VAVVIAAFSVGRLDQRQLDDLNVRYRAYRRLAANIQIRKVAIEDNFLRVWSPARHIRPSPRSRTLALIRAMLAL
jgi:hypothetical protein